MILDTLPRFSQISNGEYKEWLPLFLPNPKALQDFPLRLIIGVANNQCLFFSDTLTVESEKVSEPNLQSEKELRIADCELRIGGAHRA